MKLSFAHLLVYFFGHFSLQWMLILVIPSWNLITDVLSGSQSPGGAFSFCTIDENKVEMHFEQNAPEVCQKS